jgi:hypothetical protein
MANDMLERLKAFMDSPEGIASMERMAEKMRREDERKRRAFEYIDKLSNKDLKIKLTKEIDRHDEAYKDRCYARGYMPHPRNLMYFVFDAAQIGGKPYKKILDDFDEAFGGGTIKYRGYYFNWIFGQGTVLRIFNSKKECIFSL